MESILQQELPKIVANGAFGKNVEFVSFEKNTDLVGQDQFIALVLFGTVVTSDGTKHEVLVKYKNNDKVRREELEQDLQFHNEVIMYEKIIPFLLACHSSMVGGLVGGPTLSRFFYGQNSFDESVENDLIILENANSLGFHLSEERLFLDYEHLVKALQAIAKFHGLSYTAKHKNYEAFREIIADIHEVNKTMQDGSLSFMVFKGLHKFGKRGIDRLIERDGARYRENEQLRRLEDLIKDGVNSVCRAFEPREPHSVLCHGDFHRNNMLFQYVDGSSRPVDTLLFDLARPLYGSPALDLSLMLFMNTTQQIRESRWNDLLNVYCDSLAMSVPAGVQVPDRAALDVEMAKSALIGLSFASIGLPFMLSESKLPEGFNLNEQIDFFLHLGGTTETEYVADVVQHVVDMSYTDV